jgi:hypothetical protein
VRQNRSNRADPELSRIPISLLITDKDTIEQEPPFPAISSLLNHPQVIQHHENAIMHF